MPSLNLQFVNLDPIVEYRIDWSPDLLNQDPDPKQYFVRIRLHILYLSF